MRTRIALIAAAIVAAVATAPASAARLAVIGDWGAGTRAQGQVAERICTEHARSPIGFILTTGDNFYPTGTATRETWDRPMACLIRARLPWRAAWGNHDVPGPSTASILGASRRYYSFVTGGVRFVVLDGNNPSSATQRRWLETTLRAERTRPVIVVSHQPARTAGLHAPSTTQQRLWEPLYRRYGVRLVLSGHNHSYERITPRGGPTFSVTGGGGADVYPCVRPTRGLVTCRPVHHFLMVEATQTRIGVRAIDTSGRVIDRVAFTYGPRTASRGVVSAGAVLALSPGR